MPAACIQYVCCQCACCVITDGVCWCVWFRSLSQERSSASSWSELITHPHKQKELGNYCSLLQEHYYQSYVRGTHTLVHVHLYTQCSAVTLCIRHDGKLLGSVTLCNSNSTSCYSMQVNKVWYVVSVCVVCASCVFVFIFMCLSGPVLSIFLCTFVLICLWVSLCVTCPLCLCVYRCVYQYM